MKQTYIFGKNSIAKLLALYLKEEGVKVAGYVLNKVYVSENMTEDGIEIVAVEDIIEKNGAENVEVYVTVGNNNLNQDRQRIIEYLSEQNIEIKTYVHPTAYISEAATIGRGTIIMERVTIQPYVSIGTGNIIWCGSTITHDCSIGDYNYIAAGVTMCGRVDIANRCFIGANSVIREDIRIGDEVVIGAGAYVNKNLSSNKVIVASKGTILPVSSTDIGGLLIH